MATAYSGTDLPDVPMVFLEFHAENGIEAEIEFCRTVMDAYEPERFELADEAEMTELWQLRRDVAFAIRAYDPDLQPLHTGDVTVHISEYGPLIAYAKQLQTEHELLVPCFGHAGDGNIHYTVMVDPDDSDQVERGESIYSAVVHRALEIGGTATGEHGIGLGKREYLRAEHGKETVEAMRAVKDALDPQRVLNPGKIFPAEGDDSQSGIDREDNR